MVWAQYPDLISLGLNSDTWPVINGSQFFVCLFVCFIFLLFIYYAYFWLCWVFVSVRGLSPVGASGGHSSSRWAGLSLSRPLLLRSTGSRRSGSVVMAHGPSCSAACGIFPDQGSNPCPLHWQADSQPLHHQGSPAPRFLFRDYLGSLSLQLHRSPEKLWKGQDTSLGHPLFPEHTLVIPF